MTQADLIVAATFQSRIEADLAEGALRAHGIDAIVSRDDAGGTEPALGLIRGFRLLVRPDDQQDASEVLGSSHTDATSRQSD